MDTARLHYLLPLFAAGDTAAQTELMMHFEEDFRKIARGLSRHRETMRPTALINEYFLKLVRSDQIESSSRAHFLALSARMMRQILYQYFRDRSAAKRRPGGGTVPLQDWDAIDPGRTLPYLEVHQALDWLAEHKRRHSTVIEMHVFAGFTAAEIARELGITLDRVNLDLRQARVFIHRFLQEGPQVEA